MVPEAGKLAAVALRTLCFSLSLSLSVSLSSALSVSLSLSRARSLRLSRSLALSLSRSLALSLSRSLSPSIPARMFIGRWGRFSVPCVPNPPLCTYHESICACHVRDVRIEPCVYVQNCSPIHPHDIVSEQSALTALTNARARMQTHANTLSCAPPSPRTRAHTHRGAGAGYCNAVTRKTGQKHLRIFAGARLHTATGH